LRSQEKSKNDTTKEKKYDWKTLATIGTIIAIVVAIFGLLGLAYDYGQSSSDTNQRLTHLETSQGQVESLISGLASINNRVNNLEYILGILTHPQVTQDTNGTQQSQSLVSISYPSNNANVNWIEQIIGTSEIHNNKTLEVYVLVCPQSLNGSWYVQRETTITPDGSWWATAFFGESAEKNPENVGQKFNLAAIVTDVSYVPGQSLPELPSNALSSAVILNLTRVK
jgi:hypothetical protein